MSCPIGSDGDRKQWRVRKLPTKFRCPADRASQDPSGEIVAHLRVSVDADESGRHLECTPVAMNRSTKRFEDPTEIARVECPLAHPHRLGRRRHCAHPVPWTKQAKRFHSDRRAGNRRRFRCDLYRPNRRLVPARPRRGPDRRNGRRVDCPLCLESAGGASRHSRSRHNDKLSRAAEPTLAKELARVASIMTTVSKPGGRYGTSRCS